jgi:hypothetical protein
MNKDFSKILGDAISAKKNDEESIRSKIVIRETLREFIPLPSQEEYQQLEENILAEGLREPIVLWQLEDSFIIVDGHNRYSICQKHRLKFPFKIVEFKDEEKAKDWMVRNQLGRRNLSPEQQSYLRGLRYLNEKSQGRRTDITSGQNGPKLNSNATASRLAEEYNVSERTIKRDAQFAIGLDKLAEQNPVIKKEVLSGKRKLNKKDFEVLGRTKPQEKLKQATTSIKKKIAPNLIARIAFDFILEAFTRHSIPLQELDNANDNHLDFFIRWHEGRNQSNEHVSSNND